MGPLGALRGPISPWVWALWGPRAPLGPALGPPGPWALFAQPAIGQTCHLAVPDHLGLHPSREIVYTQIGREIDYFFYAWLEKE